MRKSLCIFLFSISMAISADIISAPFNLNPCTFLLTPSENLIEFPIDDTREQHYQYAYKDRDDKYEIRMMTFSIQPESISEVQPESFFVFTQTLMFNSTDVMDDPDYSEDFNTIARFSSLETEG